MKKFNVFETKPRVVLAFDPEHLNRLEASQVARVLEIAQELSKLPGFRGCLPCAASGLDEFAYMSQVLPAISQQKA